MADDQAANHVPSAQGRGQTIGARVYRILVVDDQEDIRRLLTLFLRHSGLSLSVLTASSGIEALNRALSEPPDLVLLDIMMPGMDGFEVCQRLREDPRTTTVPILMISGLDDSANRQKGLSIGANDYLCKPPVRGELLDRVRALLEQGQAGPTPIQYQ